MTSARFPGADGSFEVLNNHAPLIAALQGRRRDGDAARAAARIHIERRRGGGAAQPSDGAGRIGCRHNRTKSG
ncbi:MAG: hypothetical protein WKG07_10375 [Hymenobacter sp.]